METKYIVDWTSHNGDTGAWNFKQAKQFDNLSDAKKEYHNTLGTYIGYGKLDYVCVVLWDNYGNMIMSEYWDVRPQPTPPEE